MIKKKKVFKHDRAGWLQETVFKLKRRYFLWQPEFEWTKSDLFQWLMLKAYKHTFLSHYYKCTLLIWHFVLEGKCHCNIDK